ncbi:unnamed protein product [Cyclocybe aegerita]|uniref:C2H2-type domain-containing protein n=1 Tax=Cyclocybe aegerita TaxID=1973307 RepID=A0A8S0XZH3_CYCAE|nr:unnamed protein product [Cyclocybe aegerita]
MIEEFKLDRDPNQAEIPLLNLYLDSHAASISVTEYVALCLEDCARRFKLSHRKTSKTMVGARFISDVEALLAKIKLGFRDKLTAALDMSNQGFGGWPGHHVPIQNSNRRRSPLEEERGDEPTSSGPAHFHFNPHYHELHGHQISGLQVEGYGGFHHPIPGYHADEALWGLDQTPQVLDHYSSSNVEHNRPMPAPGASHVIPYFDNFSAFPATQSSQQANYFLTGSSDGSLNDPSFYHPLDYGAPATGFHFDAFPPGGSAPEAQQFPRQDLITQEQFRQAHGKVMRCRLYRGSLASGIAGRTVTDDYPLCNAHLTHPDQLIQHLKDIHRVVENHTLTDPCSCAWKGCRPSANMTAGSYLRHLKTHCIQWVCPHRDCQGGPARAFSRPDRLVEHLVRSHNSRDRDAKALVSTNRLVCFK